MKMLTSWVKTDSGTGAVMNRTVTTCMITVGHARGEENPLDSCRGAPSGRSQGDGRVYAIEAKFGCSQVMPRMCACVCALSETALDEPTGTIQDAILLLQQGDAFVTDKKKALDQDWRVGAASPGPWSIDARDLLRRDGSIYVPDDALMRHELLWVHHDDPLAGHFSADHTAELLHRKFYWKGLANDVREYVAGCDNCQRNKPHRHLPYGELAPLPLPTHPWKEITMDFITGLPVSTRWGTPYDAILIIMDRYTKVARYIHCDKEVDAEQLADIIEEEIIGQYGTPHGIITDCGSIFTSNYWSNICYHLRATWRISTAFHPQTNGLTKRQNQPVEAYMKAYCNENKDNGASKLLMAEFAYNNTVQSSIKTTPFQALYGYDLELPSVLGTEPPPNEIQSITERINGILNARKTLEQNWLEAQAQQA